MNQPQIPVQNLLKSLSLGTLSLGTKRKEAQDNLVRMFTHKKNGMEWSVSRRVYQKSSISKRFVNSFKWFI